VFGSFADPILIELGLSLSRRPNDALLGNAGFRLNRIVPTASAVSVVEAFVA
jgi:hypothetical protein